MSRQVNGPRATTSVKLPGVSVGRGRGGWTGTPWVRPPPHPYGKESPHKHASIGHGALHPQDLPLTPHPLGHLSGEEGEPRDVAEEEGDAAVEFVLLVGSQESHREEHGGICETASRVEEDHAGERHLRLHHVLHLPIAREETSTDVNGML